VSKLGDEESFWGIVDSERRGLIALRRSGTSANAVQNIDDVGDTSASKSQTLPRPRGRLGRLDTEKGGTGM